MDVYKGAKFCVVRGKNNFLTVTRTQDKNGCKKGYKMCGDKHDEDAQICVPEDLKCPISEILITDMLTEPTKKQECTSDPKSKDGKKIQLCFKRGSAMPVIRLRLEEDQPCVDKSI